MLEHFWNRWQREYLIELRENHRRSYKTNADVISIGDVVLIHDDYPRGLWKLGLVEKLIQGRDGQIRGAVKSGQGASSFLKRPVQRLFPLEVYKSVHSERIVDNKTNSENSSSSSDTQPQVEEVTGSDEVVDIHDGASEQTYRVRRQVAVEARDKIVARFIDS